MVINACYNEFKETAKDNFLVVMNPEKNILPSCIDFAVLAGTGLGLCLAYTTLRCGYLAYTFSKATTPGEKVTAWNDVSFYSYVQVVGLLVGKVALVALGIAAPAPAALLLCWGIAHASMSCYAHYRAKNLAEEIRAEALSTFH